MKVTAAIELNFAKKFIKEAWQKLKTVDPNSPIEKMFQKYGYGRTKRKYRIILKMNGSPHANTAVVVPKPLLQFLDTASENWARVKGKVVKLAFENYVTGTLYNTLEPTVPLDKRGPTYFAKLLSLNRKNLGEEQYEELRQLYDNDRQRAPATRKAIGQKYIVVISRHPYDILGYSSGRDWTQHSCLSINGCNFDDYMKHEVAGSLVAFLVPSEDFVMARIDRQAHQYPDIPKVKYSKIDKTKKNKINPAIETYRESDTVEHRPEGTWDAVFRKKLSAFDVLSRPIARIAIKPYYDEEGNMILYPGREYGNAPSEFKKRLSRFVWLHNRKQPNNEYKLASGLYPDYDQPASVYFSKSIEGLNYDQLAELAQSPVASSKTIENIWKSIDHSTNAGKHLALMVLRNNELPRHILVEAFNLDIPAYWSELAVYQSQSIGPVFLRYLLKKPKIALYLFMNRPAEHRPEVAQYLTEEDIIECINHRRLSLQELQELVKYHKEAIGNLIDTRLDLSRFTQDKEILLSELLPGKKAHIIRNIYNPEMLESVRQLVQEDPFVLTDFDLKTQITFSNASRVLTRAATAIKNELDWSTLPKSTVVSIIKYAQDKGHEVQTSQLGTIVEMQLFSSLNASERELVVDNPAKALKMYPELAPFLYIGRSRLSVQELVSYCENATNKGIEIDKDLVYHYVSKLPAHNFGRLEIVDLSWFVPLPYRVLNEELSYTQIVALIKMGGRILVTDTDAVSELFEDIALPAIITKDNIETLTTADMFVSHNLTFDDTILACVELCENDKFKQIYANKLAEKYQHTGKSSISNLSRTITTREGYLKLLKYLETEYTNGTNVTGLIARLPKAPIKFKLPLYETGIEVISKSQLHYTHVNRRLTSKDEFTICGPSASEITSEEKAQLWTYITGLKSYPSKYAPSSLPRCVPNDILAEWFHCIKDLRRRTKEMERPYFVTSISDLNDWDSDEQQELRDLYKTGAIILSKEVMLFLDIETTVTLKDIPKLIKKKGVYLSELSGPHLPVLLEWVEKYPEDYMKAVKLGKFKNLFVQDMYPELYYKLLYIVITSWTLSDYNKNRIHNVVTDFPKLSEQHIDSLIELVESTNAHAHVIVTLLQQMSIEQSEKTYQILLSRCNTFGRQYAKMLPSSFIFTDVFGVDKGARYYNQLKTTVKQVIPVST